MCSYVLGNTSNYEVITKTFKILLDWIEYTSSQSQKETNLIGQYYYALLEIKPTVCGKQMK